jgi:hypothetical protein
MWPFGKNATPFNTWPIVRTGPGGKRYGRAIQLFINNAQCHLTTVDAFSDGTVDCWGFVDLELFKQKLRSRWVVPCPIQPDQCISVFNFGSTGFRNAKWFQHSASIAAEVESIVKSLNPEMQNLIDMEGSDTELRGKVRYAKMGISDKKPFRTLSNSGKEVLGDNVSVLRVEAGAFELVPLFVFGDGLMQVGAGTPLIPVEEVGQLYAEGRITNSAPSGSTILLPGLGSFETTTDFGGISQRDRVLELSDMVNVLRGKPSVVTLCAQAFTEYEKAPSDEKKELLRHAYERVPEHLRCYCGDMDTRDTGIRRVLYAGAAGTELA